MNEIEEKPNSWWRRVYIAVVLFTILVIASLAFFSGYFSP